MSKFNDEKGKESMMRRIAWLIIIVGLSWGTAEIIYSFFISEFDIHETLILTTLSIGVTGKGVQKLMEKNQNMS